MSSKQGPRAEGMRTSVNDQGGRIENASADETVMRLRS